MAVPGRNDRGAREAGARGAVREEPKRVGEVDTTLEEEGAPLVMAYFRRFMGLIGMEIG